MSAKGVKIEAPKTLSWVWGGGVPLLKGAGFNIFIFDLLIAHFDGFSGAKYCFSLQFLNS